MDSEEENPGCPGLGCPIRVSPDKLVCSTPGLIAAYHALHRLSAPRHPPYTLSNLPALIRFPEENTFGELRCATPLGGTSDGPETELVWHPRQQLLGREDTTSVLDHPSSIVKERTTNLSCSCEVQQERAKVSFW
jgi:hypothetical protein